MTGMHGVARVLRWTAGGLGLLAVGYGMVAGTTWYRYGRVPSASPDERDPLLDQFMPEYEVAERHHVRVAAPAAMTLSAAADTDLQQSTIVRGIFRARELVLGAEPDAETLPKGLLARTTSLGWRVAAGDPRARDRRWRRHPTVAAERRLSRTCTGEVSSLSGAGRREDRLDATSRSHRRVRVDLPHRDARDDYGSDGAQEVPVVLGALFAGYRPDSAHHARTAEDRR